MNKKWIIVIVFLMTASLEAQQYHAYLGPLLGWQKASSADNGKLMYGGDVRVRLSPIFGLDGSITYRREAYDNGLVKVSTWPVMVSALVYPVNFIYGEVGGGWYNTAISYSREISIFGTSGQTEQKFGWHLGAGAEIPLGGSGSSPGAIITADVKYVFLNYNFESLPGIEGIKNNFVVVSVGYLFGL